MRRALALILLAASCDSSGECEQSADCPDADGGAGVCLDHLLRAERYCTNECVPPLVSYRDPCPLGRICESTGMVGEGGVAIDVCVERVPSCRERERCGNGLDDDCNGSTDEEPCDRITCSNDFMCEEIRASACTLLEGTRECVRMTQPRNAGSRCESHEDCYNRQCAEGYCAPACGVADDRCPDAYECVNTAVGFSACLLSCLGNEICNRNGGTDGRCVARAFCTDPSNPDTCFVVHDVCVR